MIEIIVIVIFIIIIFISVGVVFLLNKRETLFEDGSIIYIWDSTRTEGRVVGTVISEETSTGGDRVIFQFKPKDVTYNDFDKDEIQSIITPKTHILVLPVGSVSKGRTIIHVFPFEVENFSKHFDNNNLEHLFTEVSKMGDTNLRLSTLKEKVSRMTDQMKEYAEGEVSPYIINQFKNFLMEVSKIVETDKNKHPSSGYQRV